MLLITGHARWAGMVFAGYARIEREEGVTDQDVALREDATFRQLITADAYPALRAAIDAGVFLDAADPFSFNLARSLDGLEAYIALAADGRRDQPQPWPQADGRRHRRRQALPRGAQGGPRGARGRCATHGGRSGRPRARRESGGRGCGSRR